MMTHTKGPWTYTNDLAKGRIITARIHDRRGERPAPIATIGGYKDRVVNNEANARLIASAPDLLEALEAMLTIHQWNMEKAGYNPPVCDCELCENAREAIQKARG